MHKKAPFEGQSSTIDHSDAHEGRKIDGIFLTDIGTSKYIGGNLKNIPTKSQLSKKSARIASEKMISHEKVTFIHHPESIEDNKSFNVVK